MIAMTTNSSINVKPRRRCEPILNMRLAVLPRPAKLQNIFDAALRARRIRQTFTHYEMLNRNSWFSRVVNRTIGRCRRLAAMARAAAKRGVPGDRPAQRVAQGRTDAALEGGRRRLRLLDPRRGRRPALPAG